MFFDILNNFQVQNDGQAGCLGGGCLIWPPDFHKMSKTQKTLRFLLTFQEISRNMSKSQTKTLMFFDFLKWKCQKYPLANIEKSKKTLMLFKHF